MGDTLPCLHCSTDTVKVRHFMSGQCPGERATRTLTREDLHDALRAHIPEWSDRDNAIDRILGPVPPAQPSETAPAPLGVDPTDALYNAFEEGVSAGIEEQIHVGQHLPSGQPIDPTPRDQLWQRSEAFEVAARLRALAEKGGAQP